MARGHTLVRRILAVARILGDVVGADNALASKGRSENLRGARHAEALELRPICAGKRVEHVARAFLVEHIVEERTELCARQFDASVGHHLDDPLEVELGCDGSPRPI